MLTHELTITSLYSVPFCQPPPPLASESNLQFTVAHHFNDILAYSWFLSSIYFHTPCTIPTLDEFILSFLFAGTRTAGENHPFGWIAPNWGAFYKLRGPYKTLKALVYLGTIHPPSSKQALALALSVPFIYSSTSPVWLPSLILPKVVALIRLQTDLLVTKFNRHFTPQQCSTCWEFPPSY